MVGLYQTYPIVAEALVVISAKMRNQATLLEVLVATKMGTLFGFDSTEADA